MITLYDSLFGIRRMIIIHLIEWVKTIIKPDKAISEGFSCTFPMPAIPTRHEVTRKPETANHMFFQDLKIKP